MNKIIDDVIKPRYSNLTLVFLLTVLLFATYFVLVPSIVKRYEAQLDEEKHKLLRAVTRIESAQAKLDTTLTDLGRVQMN